MKIKLSDYELGWIVGILEGEGHFDYNGCSQKVQVRMVDYDTMLDVSILLSKIVGKILNITSRMPGGNKQEIFEITLCGDNARAIMKTIVPYMHSRRRGKIWQALNKYREPKKSGLDELEAILNNQGKEANARSAAAERTNSPDDGRDTVGPDPDDYVDPYGP